MLTSQLRLLEMSVGLDKQAILGQYHVLCGVTGQQIPLSELKYWNVERQIPYLSPEIIPVSHFYPHLVGERS